MDDHVSYEVLLSILPIGHQINKQMSITLTFSENSTIKVN